MLPTKALVLCAVLAASTEKSCEEDAQSQLCEPQGAKELSDKVLHNDGDSQLLWVCGKLNGEYRCVRMVHCAVKGEEEKSK